MKDEEIFAELKRRCDSKTVYSVREVAADMGVNYDYIEQCAAQDEDLNEMLQMCRSHCWCNVMDAGLYSKLPLDMVHKYWRENDDEYAQDTSEEYIPYE